MTSGSLPGSLLPSDSREGLSPEPSGTSFGYEIDDDDIDSPQIGEENAEFNNVIGESDEEEDDDDEYEDADEEMSEDELADLNEDEERYFFLNSDGAIEEGDGTQNGGEGSDSTTMPPSVEFSASELYDIIRDGRFQHLFSGGGGSLNPNSRFSRPPPPTAEEIERKFPKVPSEAGRALMRSGTYGCEDCFTNIRKQRQTDIGKRLVWRRLGFEPRGYNRRANHLISQDMVPSTAVADKIIHYSSRAYSGQFSDDGNFFFSCTQNFKVRMYDTSNPYGWKYYKTVEYPFGSWTITDASLSPDNRWLAYSSIQHLVCLAPTDPSETSEPSILDLTNTGSRRRQHLTPFGIWSLRFSGDGREIVAGTSDHAVVVYDIETRKTILNLNNHNEDVNAVCFADKASPHILYSGSDDQTIRVWDRRSMADGREAGVFVGHTEGLTYVDSKGDGRYVLSNAKDQQMKLWDLRKMQEPSIFEVDNIRSYSSNIDYRFQTWDPKKFRPHPLDSSVVTFRGHSVHKTLIRCHFSPPGSTNSRYVYSGSQDGGIYIWNLDGTPKSKIDVQAATEGSRPQHPHANHQGNERWQTCVRDASWHPNAPVIAGVSWNGWGCHNGTVSLHSWNDGIDDDEGEPPITTNYNARLEVMEDYNKPSRLTRDQEGGLRSRRVARSAWGELPRMW